MTKKLIVNANFTENYGLEEWAQENLETIKSITGLDLIPETIIAVHGGFVVKNEILEQTFFVRCDEEKSDEYDLGCVIIECALQEPDGVIWLTNDLEDDLKQAFNWLCVSLGKDFNAHLIEIEINNTKK